MKSRALRARVVAVVLALAACHGESVRARGTGHGTVAGIDGTKHEVTLDHGPVPGVMSAMVMTYSVSDPKVLDGVTPGEKVEFDVEARGKEYVVTGIRPR